MQQPRLVSQVPARPMTPHVQDNSRSSSNIFKGLESSREETWWRAWSRWSRRSSTPAPITSFIEDLYVNFDFYGAQQKLRDCKLLWWMIPFWWPAWMASSRTPGWWSSRLSAGSQVIFQKIYMCCSSSEFCNMISRPKWVFYHWFRKVRYANHQTPPLVSTLFWKNIVCP